MAINWDAIFEQWPWFAAAAGVLVVVIGLLILLRPKSKRQPITAGSAVDSKEWVLTGQNRLRRSAFSRGACASGRGNADCK